MNEKNEVSKPLSMRKDEYIAGVIDLTNNSGLPIFIVEYILRDLLVEVRGICNQQAELDRADYQKRLKSLDGCEAVF